MTFAAFRDRPGRGSAGALAAALFSTALFSTALSLPTAALPAERPARSQSSATLAELADAADFVGLAQVRDTDYLRRRGIPVSGSAYLAVLIPYRADRATDLIEIYEKGLHTFECYFPNPTVFEEGRRYLVFLQSDPEHTNRFRGLPQGCALEVLVGRDNRYAVRMPPTGLNLAPSQQDLLRDMALSIDFSDPYAIVDEESLPPDQRDTMVAAGEIVPYAPEAPSRQWKYTRGIPLEQFRELLHLEPQP